EQIFRASLSIHGATQARCLRAAPTRRACDNQGKKVSPTTATSFAEPAIENGLIRVDTAVAEEWPVAACIFAFLRIAFDDEDFFLFAARLGGDLAERISDERISPEFEAGVAVFRIAFIADAIYNGDVRSVRDGVCALNCAPCVKLCGAELRLFFRVPA